jgi:hypothetical protein
MPKAKEKSALQKKKDNPGSLYWRKKADKAWSDAVKKDAGGICAVCAAVMKQETIDPDSIDPLRSLEDELGFKVGLCGGNLEAHHILPRTKLDFRHDVNNGIALCGTHHRMSNHCSPHKGSFQFNLFLKLCRPDLFHAAMKNLKRDLWGDGSTKGVGRDYKAIYEGLKEKHGV